MKTVIPDNYTPDMRIYEMCKEKGIPEDFMLGEITAFRLYWEDTKKKKDSWRSTFWNRVKSQWFYHQEAERKHKGSTVQFKEMEKPELAKSRPSLRDMKALIYGG